MISPWEIRTVAKKNRKLRVLPTDQPLIDDCHDRPVNRLWGSAEERREHLQTIIQKWEKQNDE